MAGLWKRFYVDDVYYSLFSRRQTVIKSYYSKVRHFVKTEVKSVFNLSLKLIFLLVSEMT